ncbi:MAG TPA: nitroreductase family deazaflavin-dependent oxidoreductase [Candidatus Limnocylindrales bacterium]
MAEPLVRSGRVARLETRGRRSGRRRVVAVGFVDGQGGSLLVAAASPTADWARNLAAHPHALVTVAERTWPVVAEPLDGAEHADAVRELILKYGTPSERLGRGPSFRLRPT